MPPNNTLNAANSVNSISFAAAAAPPPRRRALTDVSNNPFPAPVAVGAKRSCPSEEERAALFENRATRRRVDRARIPHSQTHQHQHQHQLYNGTTTGTAFGAGFVHVSSNTSLQNLCHPSEHHITRKSPLSASVTSRMSVDAILCHPEPVPLVTPVPVSPVLCKAGLVIDIDSIDRYNHLAVPSLASTIHASLLERERKYAFQNLPSPTYMQNIQPHITARMRRIVVDWLVDVHKDFKFSQTTLHLTVNIMDRFLSKVVIARSKFQLLAITSLWIASKYQERCTPYLDDFVAITNWSYTRLDMFNMESAVCNTLQFRFTVVTALPFLARSIKALSAATSSANDGADTNGACGDGDGNENGIGIENLAGYIIELALCEYRILKYRPSLIAAAAVAIASNALKRQKQATSTWDENMKFHSGGYDIQDLNDCAIDLCRIITDIPSESNANITAVRRKYSTSTFGAVALNNFNFHIPTTVNSNTNH